MGLNHDSKNFGVELELEIPRACNNVQNRNSEADMEVILVAM